MALLLFWYLCFYLCFADRRYDVINDYHSVELLVRFESICLQRSSLQSQCDFGMYLDAAIGFGMQRHVARTKSGETGLR